MVDPKILCVKHLLGEHVELHMFMGTMKSHKSLAGYLRNKLLEPNDIIKRHDQLVEEILRRGYRHQSPINPTLYEMAMDEYHLHDYHDIVDPVENKIELAQRCEKCRQLQDADQ